MVLLMHWSFYWYLYDLQILSRTARNKVMPSMKTIHIISAQEFHPPLPQIKDLQQVTSCPSGLTEPSKTTSCTPRNPVQVYRNALSEWSCGLSKRLSGYYNRAISRGKIITNGFDHFPSPSSETRRVPLWTHCPTFLWNNEAAKFMNENWSFRALESNFLHGVYCNHTTL